MSVSFVSSRVLGSGAAGALLLGAGLVGWLGSRSPAAPPSAPGAAAPAPAAPVALAGPTAVVVGPSLGWLEPCGCSGGQLGGVHRLGSALSIAGQGADALRVACGGVVAPEASTHRDWALSQLETIWYGFGLVGMDVVGLSSTELALEGLADLRALLPPETAVVATNLRAAAADEPWFATHAAPPRGPAVLALLPEGLEGPGWRTVPAAEALAEVAPALPSGPVLALVEGDERRAAALGDLLVEALGERPIVVVRHGERGEADHELSPAGERGALGAFPGARLRYAVRVGFEPRPTWSPTPVSENLPASDELDQLRESYRFSLAASAPPVVEQLADRLGLAPGGKYTGSQACESCHADEYAIWEESLHAHALETLADDFRGAAPGTMDPQCIGCHTVGYGHRTGFGSQALAPERRFGPESGLAGVGCESCHGPGEKHAATQLPGDIESGRAAPGEPSHCVRCHDSDNDPSFSFEKKWTQIRH